MRSVADELRREQLEKVQTLSADERLLLAFDLGETALEMYMGAQGLDREEAIRRLKRQRQAGRRPSKCMIDLLG